MCLTIESRHIGDLYRHPSSPVMTRNEIEDKISSLKSEEIHAIAQNIVASVMNFLKISVPKEMTDEDEDLYGSYNLESIKYLTTKIEKLLQEAFSAPSRFFDEGVLVLY